MATATLTIQQQFELFQQLNPHVYDRLCVMARQAKARGVTKIGIGMLWETLRWDVLMGTVRLTGDFKLNNNFRSRYARLIMANERDLVGFFELRALRAQ